jgi:hypothetical protein
VSAAPAFDQAKTEQCMAGALLSKVTASSYDSFASYSNRALQTYRQLSKRELDCIYDADSLLKATNSNETPQAILDRVSRFPGLDGKQKENVIDIMGLRTRTVGEAYEIFKRNFEYLFWADHSSTHAKEIVQVSRTLWKDAPPSIKNYFFDVLSSNEWRTRIEQAILIHDSRMAESRELHSELCLDADPSEFPSDWSARDRDVTSILAMLHSKSTVPYSILPKWPEYLENTILPRLVKGGQLSESRAEEITKTVQSLSADEIQKMSLAASWIRVADANRPIGTQLKNSIGQKYVLTSSGRDVRLQTPRGKIKVPPGQDVFDYGQIAIRNLVLSENSSGKLMATFRLRVPEPLRSQLRSELSDQSATSWQAKAISEAIKSIMGDFPPELLKKITIEVE